MIGGVGDLIVVQQPGVTAGRRIAMSLPLNGQAMFKRALIVRVTEAAKSHRIIEDEARAAHQMPGMRVVDAAVVAEEVMEAAGRIDGARMVKSHRVADVIKQEARVTKVG